MDQKKMDRREFLKLEAAAMAAAAGGMAAPAAAQNLVTDRAVTELKWDKAPCRFCGTGCGVMVATKDGRVVATHGDIKAEVNRGLNCVKGYFLSKVMYGHDRLTRPLLRKRNGRYDKNGEFTPVSWDEAFDVMAEKFKDALQAGAAPPASACSARANGRSGKATPPTSCSRPASVPTTSIPNARHCMASAVMGFMRLVRHRRADGLLRRFRGRRRLRAVGLEHGRDAPDPVEPGHRPAAQRAACARRRALDLRAPLVRSRRYPDGVQAADRSRDPQRDRQPHHHDRPREQGLRQQAHGLQARPDRHRLRAAAGAPAGAEGDRPHEGRRRDRHHVRGLREIRLRIHAGEGVGACPACR